MGHATAVTKSHHTDLAAAFRPILQNASGGHKVFPCLGLIQLGEQLTRLVFITRIATQWGQRVRRKRHEIVERETPGNIFNVGIEPAVFMHHQYAGQLACGIGGFGQITFDGTVAVG